MSLGDILIAIGTGSISIADAIARGSFGKIGANITEKISNKFVSAKNTDDLDDQNRFYCPFCGTSIEHKRIVCLGCHADVVYGTTKEEQNSKFISIFLFGGLITYLILVAIPKLLNHIFNWNISSRFGLDISQSLYVWMFVVFCLLILFLYLEKKASLPQRIRCRRYCVDTKKYIYKDVEYKTRK